MRHLFGEKKLVYQVITRRDPEAYGALYDLYLAKIYRFVYFKVGGREEAEDITSTVFLKTWHYLVERKPEEVQSFSGLVYRIARNCLVDHYRTKAHNPSVSLDSAVDIGALDEQFKAAENRADAQPILRVISQLKREYQEVLLLRYVEDLSVGEIAEILEKTPTNVRVTLHRALRLAKERVEEAEKKISP